MPYSPVVDRFPVPIPLDPLTFIAFVALFVICVLVTLRRPSYGLAALLFVMPFAGYREILGTDVTAPKVAVLAVLLGLLGHTSIRAVFRERRFRALTISIALVVIATAMTLLHAEHIGPVLRETLKWCDYLLLVVTAYGAYRLDPDDAVLVRVLSLSVLIVCCSALVQEFIGAPSALLLQGHVVARIAGVLEGPNQLAGYLEIAIALLASWYVPAPRRLTSAILVAAAATVILTFSRGGVFGCIVAIVIVGWTYREHLGRLLRPIVAGGALGTGSWIALTFVEGISAHANAMIRDSSAYAGGVGNRTELWRAAWFFFRSHPLLGIGAGNYELELARANVFGVRTHANSWYLQSLAEGGVVLFMTVLGFLATTFTVLLRDRLRSPWTAGALAASVALALHQSVDFLVFYPKVGGMWMLAIALGAAASATPRARSCD